MRSVTATEPDLGLPAYLTQIGDADYEHFAVELLKQREPGPFWLFAYGSLIWKPAYDPVEHCRATAHGWHRGLHHAPAALARHAGSARPR